MFRSAPVGDWTWSALAGDEARPFLAHFLELNVGCEVVAFANPLLGKLAK
jgi:hypothetical protein